MISAVNLGKQYGAHEVLRNVTVNVQPGAIHGLVGINGAGKTTLLHCLYGLLNDYTGSVHETTGLSIRQHTGLLPYEPYFYPRLTGREYVEFCLQARGQPLVELAGWSQLLELPLDQYAEEYSAGMKKKLALLALLVQNFRYLILDEPFNGLDLGTNLLVQEMLRKLRARGTGILLTSHLLGSLTDVCDELTVLAEGTVRRRYARPEFDQVGTDLLAGEYQEKVAWLRQLLPEGKN